MLERAVESVLKQTYKNIEIIISDDGSDDGTEEYCCSIILCNSNITYIRSNRSYGACHARNKAISVAKGEYITGLDDDDLLKPNHISELVTAFSTDYSFVCTSYIENSSKGKINRNNKLGIVTIEKLLHYNIVGNQVLTLTKRIQDIGGFDESLPAFQDYDLWVRLVKSYGSGFKIDNLSYVWDNMHAQERISSSLNKTAKAYEIFYSKHKLLMNHSNKKSMKIMNVKYSGTKLSLCTLIKNINIYNYKLCISLYLRGSFKYVIEFIDYFRYK
ncbi:glycosyltransferase [Vibrio sp. JC009]|nr:glycosyltransferase [Vibrio sp. JC009]